MIRTVTLGDTGIEVNAIGLGAMPLSLDGRPGRAAALEVIQAFINGGGNFIDTANVYCRDDDDIGHNEQLIRDALARYKAGTDIIVATKGGLTRPRGRWEVNATPDWIQASCEKSLRDLDTDSIFLYQLHAPDPKVPITESVGAMIRLREQGKIRHIGLSNVNTDQIRTALEITPVLSVQNRCNFLERKSFSSGVVDLCHEENIVFIPHSPVGGHFDHGKLQADKSLKQVAKKYNCSVYQVALAWLLHQGDHILPIPGASKVSSITSSLAAGSLTLQDTDLELLD